MKKLLIALLVLAGLFLWYLQGIDGPQREGVIDVASLQGEVRVLRGDDGVPYIYADSLDDVLTAQAFLHAQDRLFQLEIHRHLAQGRLSEFIGEKGLKNDRIVRLVDIWGYANEYAKRISARERNYLQRYVNGLNDYITTRQDEFPLMLGVIGHEVKPWSLEELLAVVQFRIWSSSVNWKQELLTLRLYDELGPVKAAQLYPVAINPDDPRTYPEMGDRPQFSENGGLSPVLGFAYDDSLFSQFEPLYRMGSDAWATSPAKSVGDAPILSGDPHLQVGNLPGFWFPMGAVTPEHRFVGGTMPGTPGWGIGRNAHIAFSATNGYSDMVDLYLEVVDPANGDNYLEGERSIPFVVRTETLRIKDGEAEGGYRSEQMVIRETNRGPVISDHGMSMAEGRVLSLRWSVPEYSGPEAGNLDLLLATSVDEAVEAIADMATPLNHVVADVHGNIALVPSGFVPQRSRGDGLVPLQVTGEDNWVRRIPPAEMPLQVNPARQWVGSTNHRITDADYPYVYSTHFSPRWRYMRLQQVMEREHFSADDHWAANNDTLNTFAEYLRPRLVRLFAADEALAPMAEVLRAWNLHDDPQEAGPLIFQSVFRNLANEVFADDMSEDLLKAYLDEQYYWVDRFVTLLETESPWVDDSGTEQVESADDLMLRAGHLALAELSAKWGGDPAAWRWGDEHTMTFFHPFIPGERAARLIGGGVHPVGGSSETLQRGIYKFSAPYKSTIADSMRIAIDLADDEKIIGHFPGGISERWFSEWNATFVEAWVKGEQRYLWFSDEKIAEHTDAELLLRP